MRISDWSSDVGSSDLKESRKVKDLVANLEAPREAKDALEAGTPVIDTAINRTLLRELSLLTAKPFIYVLHCDAEELADEELKNRLRALIEPSSAIFLVSKFYAGLLSLQFHETLEFLPQA